MKEPQKKLALKLLKMTFFKKTILIYNYFNILISNSIAKNKLSFPKLNKIKTFDTNVSQLLERKEYI